MNYHNITFDDMKNGDGLRVVLWLSGCEHHCKGCHNPLTWNPDDGLIFGYKEKDEIFKALEKEHISGITFSGGDPFHVKNRYGVHILIQEIKEKYPDKTIWLYTGYTWDFIINNTCLSHIIKDVDILVDGKYERELHDVNYPWAGSTNQRVIKVQESLQKGEIVLHESN